MNDFLERISVNNTVYHCFEIDATNGFHAVLRTDDMDGVKANFTDVTEIVIMNNIGQVRDFVTGLSNKPAMITEMPDYYADDEGNLYSAIAITIRKVDVVEQIKQLESKLDTTVNEVDMTLEEYKEYRIKQSKDALKEYLETHPITSTAHGGVEDVYSITEEKQNQMMRSYLMYEIEKKINPDTAVIKWNQTGEECTVFTEQEFTTLAVEIKATVSNLVSYQQSIEAKIRKSVDKAEIAAMIFDFDKCSAE